MTTTTEKGYKEISIYTENGFWYVEGIETLKGKKEDILLPFGKYEYDFYMVCSTLKNFMCLSDKVEIKNSSSEEVYKKYETNFNTLQSYGYTDED